MRRRSAADHSPCCPLCAAADTRSYHLEERGEYLHCNRCALVFLHPSRRPTPLTEVLRYLEHENHVRDRDYAQFLRRLADPVRARLSPGAVGLDFGCGPAPALAEILTASGCPTAAYDPLFRPDEALLAHGYDFVTCSEVLEHLHQPDRTFELFRRLLPRGGLLGVMTRFHDDAQTPFGEWWYRRDPTHVCFYQEETMRWVARRYGWQLELPVADVALFSLPAP